MKRKILVVLMMALALTVLGSGMGQAALFPLTSTSGNSQVLIDTNSPNGVVQWVVDGVNQLSQQQWFVGLGAGPQIPVGFVPSSVIGATQNFVDILYNGGPWSLEATYTLSGGQFGTRMSDLVEQATFNNLTGSLQTLRLYLYANFDLNGSHAGDSVTLEFLHHAVQTGKGMMSDTVLGPNATHDEANVFPSTLLHLLGPTYTLNDASTAGPGDVTWAFEWIVDVPAHGSFQVSLDKLIQPAPVPVPPSVILLGSGLLGLAGIRFRRTRA
jgi:hypothetical protein